MTEDSVKTPKKRKLGWQKKWGSDQVCPITFSRLRPGNDSNGIPYCIKLNCGHRFWRKPLYQWLLTAHTSCPVCRAPVLQLTNKS